ncbi:MAG TPA: NAD(P)-binding domain-containing protein, partial [Candidatus Dormibacteraeota bacterium]|nr:NAD(P)-binding domain-containing protein [Candidatus Dormibacteraeota bacterium]
MQIGMIGLGRMGGNMVVRLLRKGHHVVAFDQSAEAVARAEHEGAAGAHSLEQLVQALTDRPRAVWVMVPSGDPTSQTIKRLSELCDRGDIVIDGGNTNWRDALKDVEVLRAAGVHYLD